MGWENFNMGRKNFWDDIMRTNAGISVTFSLWREKSPESQKAECNFLLRNAHSEKESQSLYDSSDSFQFCFIEGAQLLWKAAGEQRNRKRSVSDILRFRDIMRSVRMKNGLHDNGYGFDFLQLLRGYANLNDEYEGFVSHSGRRIIRCRRRRSCCHRSWDFWWSSIRWLMISQRSMVSFSVCAT